MKTGGAIQTAPTRSPRKLLETDPFFERLEQIHEAVARRAYELFVSNGLTHGHDLEDWLRAESEILQPVPVEVGETDEGFTVRVKVPGFKEKEIELHVEPRIVYISGQREEKAERKKGKTVYSEWRSDRISRSLELPAEVNPDNVKATLNDGVLDVRLQKVRTTKTVPKGSEAA
jgi:HSP20 family molecular chaperone IbpA